MNLDKNTLAGLLAPAAVGALGGGALVAHLSNRVRRPHESPQEHRRRVIRNALMGAALGGTAGAVIPGARLAGSTFSSAKPGLLSRGADAGIGGLAHNFAGLGVGTIGGLAVHRNNAKARGRAREILAGKFFDTEKDPGKRLGNLEAMLSNSDEMGKSIKRYTEGSAGGEPIRGADVRAREHELSGLLEAAGHKHEFDVKLGPGADAQALTVERQQGRAALKSHLGGQGVLSRILAGKINPEGGEGLLESGRLAQHFKKLTSPGAWKSVRRIAPAVGAAAVIPAAVMANRAQHQLMGE